MAEQGGGTARPVAWAHVSGELLDELGSRVKVLVHAVTKSEELLLLVFDRLQEGRDVVRRFQPDEHLDDSLIGATMQRPVQRSNSTCIAGALSILTHPRVKCAGQHRHTRAP